MNTAARCTVRDKIEMGSLGRDIPPTPPSLLFAEACVEPTCLHQFHTRLVIDHRNAVSCILKASDVCLTALAMQAACACEVSTCRKLIWWDSLHLAI